MLSIVIGSTACLIGKIVTTILGASVLSMSLTSVPVVCNISKVVCNTGCSISQFSPISMTASRSITGDSSSLWSSILSLCESYSQNICIIYDVLFSTSARVRIKVSNRHSTYGRVKVKIIQLGKYKVQQNGRTDLKEELAKTAIQITCFDRDGKEVKRVTSTSGEVEDPDNGGGENPENGGGGSSSESGNGGGPVNP